MLTYTSAKQARDPLGPDAEILGSVDPARKYLAAAEGQSCEDVCKLFLVPALRSQEVATSLESTWRLLKASLLTVDTSAIRLSLRGGSKISRPSLEGIRRLLQARLRTSLRMVDLSHEMSYYQLNEYDHLPLASTMGPAHWAPAHAAKRQARSHEKTTKG